MSTSIFPVIPSQRAQGADDGLPLYREVKWDLEKNKPVYVNGAPAETTGAEAVLTWACNVLQVKRGVFEALSRDIGCEIYTLTGRPYTAALKNAEAIRYVTECLTINPYIEGVKDVSVDFEDGTLEIAFTIVTVYGEVSGDVAV